jgi:PAS domain S-box-containing protein
MYNNPNPVYHKNSNLKYVGCNKAFEKLTGFSSNFIFGSTVNEIFSENISKLSDIKDKELIENLNKTSHQIYTCKLFNRNTESEIEVMVYNSAIMDKDNNFTGIMGTIIDLTDYMNAKKSAKLFESVLNETCEPVVIINNTGEVTFCNRSFLELLNYSKAEFFKLTPPQYLEFSTNENEVILITKSNTFLNKKVRKIKIPNDEFENTLFIFN